MFFKRLAEYSPNRISYGIKINGKQNVNKNLYHIYDLRRRIKILILCRIGVNLFLTAISRFSSHATKIFINNYVIGILRNNYVFSIIRN